jgi:hypothetical protein
MIRPNLVQWQRDVYPEVHSLRSTLLVHAVTVPVFVAATFGFVAALFTLHPLAAALCVGIMAGAYGAEAVMHRREPRSYAVEGAADGLSRLFVEHFVTFWRFVLDGGWARAYRDAR